MSGIDYYWMGVGTIYPLYVRAKLISYLSFISAKFLNFLALISCMVRNVHLSALEGRS